MSSPLTDFLFPKKSYDPLKCQPLIHIMSHRLLFIAVKRVRLTLVIEEKKYPGHAYPH